MKYNQAQGDVPPLTERSDAVTYRSRGALSPRNVSPVKEDSRSPSRRYQNTVTIKEEKAKIKSSLDLDKKHRSLKSKMRWRFDPKNKMIA